MNTDKIYAQQLANEYAPKNAPTVVALRKLDAKAKRPANILVFTLGTLSALMLGVGMCLSMHVIASGTLATIGGILLGLLGLAGISANYPIYKKKLEADKQKYAYDIVQLARQISQEDEENESL